MKTLLLIHGFGVDSGVFEPIAKKLSKSYKIILVDLPGHGSSNNPFVSFDDSADFIIGVIRKNASKVSLLGWSMGGQIALIAAAKAPDLFESLILLSSAPKFVSGEDYKFGYNRALFKNFFKRIKSDTSRAMKGFYELMFSRNEKSNSYLGLLKNMKPDEDALVKCMEDFEKQDQRSLLQKISVPTLILSGSEDEICSNNASKYLKENIPDAKLVTLEGGGHALQLTRGDEIINEITMFIG